VAFIWNFLAVLMLAPALATAANAAAPAGGTANGNVRLENLQIEIWPEYDRPAALVILRGELAADVSLPATVSLRIPASTGGPAAVAYATEKKGGLLNLKHDRADAADFITLRFAVPARFFHVEFYDRFATAASARTYKYLWPGDLAVNWLDVVVQEPAGASGISILPELKEKSAGADGMQYRSAQLGPAKQGVPLPIEIQYTKSDPRTSVEILKLAAPAPSPAPQAALPAAALPQTTTPLAGKEPASALVPALITAALVIAAAGAAMGGYFFWIRRRPSPQGAPAAGGRFCTKCGHGVASEDRFCPKCGAALA